MPKDYTYTGSGTNSQVREVLLFSTAGQLTDTWGPVGKSLLQPRLRNLRQWLSLLQPVGHLGSILYRQYSRICPRDGSYYYSNPNGSTYYNSGNGYSQYTSPSGGVYKSSK